MDQRGSLAKSLATAKGVPQKDIPDEMMQEFKVAVSRDPDASCQRHSARPGMGSSRRQSAREERRPAAGL